MKKCPYCAEEIQDEAIYCRYCDRDLIQKSKIKSWISILFGFAIALIIYIYRIIFHIEYPQLWIGNKIVDVILGFLGNAIFYSLLGSIILWIWRVTLFRNRYHKIISKETGFSYVLILTGLFLLFITFTTVLEMNNYSVINAIATEQARINQAQALATQYFYATIAPTKTRTPYPISTIVRSDSWRIPMLKSHISFVSDENDKSGWGENVALNARSLAIESPYRWEVYTLPKRSNFRDVSYYYKQELSGRGFQIAQDFYNDELKGGVISFILSPQRLYVIFWAEDKGDPPTVMVIYKNIDI